MCVTSPSGGLRKLLCERVGSRCLGSPSVGLEPGFRRDLDTVLRVDARLGREVGPFLCPLGRLGSSDRPGLGFTFQFVCALGEVRGGLRRIVGRSGSFLQRGGGLEGGFVTGVCLACGRVRGDGRFPSQHPSSGLLIDLGDHLVGLGVRRRIHRGR